MRSASQWVVMGAWPSRAARACFSTWVLISRCLCVETTELYTQDICTFLRVCVCTGNSSQVSVHCREIRQQCNSRGGTGDRQGAYMSASGRQHHAHRSKVGEGRAATSYSSVKKAGLKALPPRPSLCYMHVCVCVCVCIINYGIPIEHQKLHYNDD